MLACGGQWRIKEIANEGTSPKSSHILSVRAPVVDTHYNQHMKNERKTKKQNTFEAWLVAPGLT